MTQLSDTSNGVRTRPRRAKGRIETTWPKLRSPCSIRVVVGVVDMLDMQQLIDHVPINKVVARVDLPEVIEEIDLAGIIRESTTGLGTETLDASRAGLMAMDLWSARLVDRILRRKEPRDLTVRWNGIARQESAKPEVIS